MLPPPIPECEQWCQVWGGDQVWLDTAHNASTTYNNNTPPAFATNRQDTDDDSEQNTHHVM